MCLSVSALHEHYSLSLPGVSELRKGLCTRGWSRAVGHSLGACASCWGVCVSHKVGVWGREWRECVCLPANLKLDQPVSKRASGWGITLTGSQCCHAWAPCEQGVPLELERECMGVCSEPQSGPTSNWETCGGGKGGLDAGR